ncbi:MAG: CAP domain-containing protein [bacterium]
MGKTRTWFKYALLGGILFKMTAWFLSTKSGRKFWSNFSNLAVAEKEEFTKFVQQEESLDELMVGSGSLLKDYFIPGSHNDCQPKILRTKSLLYIVLPLLACKLLLAGYLFWLYPNSAQMSRQISEELSILVNQVRLDNGLQPLQVNQELQQAAWAKAQDIINQDYFNHNGFDGKKPWEWIDDSRYQYELVGENLATNFASAPALFEVLLNNGQSKKNILNSNYQDMGLAVVSGHLQNQPTNILVQLLANQQPPATAIASEPPAQAIIDEDQTGQVLGERLPQSEVKLSPNLLLENQNQQAIVWQSATDGKLVGLAKQSIVWLRWVYLSVFIILALALFLNIVIKIKQQYRHLIIQTLLALLILGGLCWWPWHLLENLTGPIGLL